MPQETTPQIDRRRERLETLSPAKRALLLKALQKEAQLAGEAAVIGKRPAQNTAPVSFAQRRLLFIDHLFPGSPSYNIPAGVRLRGPLNASVLERCFQEEVNRHEALRTVFGFVNGEPVQQILPATTARLPLIDLSVVPDNERESAARELAKREARQPFQLDRGPLVRLSLLRLSDDDHIALLTMHHIISDAWSMDVFISELATLYEAFTTEQSAALLAPPLQYGDYAYWQTQRSQETLFNTQLDYWKKQLQGVTLLPKLTTDWPRPATQTFNGAQHALFFDKEVLGQVQDLSRRTETTPFIILLAVLKIVLHVFTGQSDIVVGTPVNNRRRVELEAVIGLFINTLVLRTDLSGNPTFVELLARARDVVLGAHANQELPFETVVNALQVERDLAQTPLFGVWFLFQVAPQGRELSNLTLTGYPIDHGITHYDLRLNLLESSAGIGGTIEYNTDLFRPQTINRLAGQFSSLLHLALSSPQKTLNELTATLREADAARKLARQSEQKQARLNRLKNVNRRAIVVAGSASDESAAGTGM
jgi:Condensation domain